MRAHAAQRLIEVCEQVKITWSHVWTAELEKKSPIQVICASGLYFLNDPYTQGVSRL
jgi:hypothetical protein